MFLYLCIADKHKANSIQIAISQPGSLRIGTTEVTRFGMKEQEMDTIADLIVSVLSGREKPEVVQSTPYARVQTLAYDAFSSRKWTLILDNVISFRK
ncbi:hypothetical protein E8L90_09035 [Brevibacillus antibioticus]|uniref:Uncharacterized protein n=1 Tax=Brevibacillus antibioticus TaxID=2570228 RepID=A0A4U2Y538_9BACL|nr:hypothetical protein [Brevibacillus antibioticus]TKI55579.1 hypothetical protein E8L90_09035 [Brevibacillus antibioticus]